MVNTETKSSAQKVVQQNKYRKCSQLHRCCLFHGSKARNGYTVLGEGVVPAR
jgi:hypothetical protein